MAYQRAFRLNPTDARVFYEFDQLAKRLNHPLEDRLERLNNYHELVEQRDDLYLEYVTLLNSVGSYETALDRLLSRNFHPWEGGEGKVPAQFVLAIAELAKLAIEERRYADAIQLLQQTEVWPRCLGEGKLTGIQENNINYLVGLAHRGLRDEHSAVDYFEKAAVGISEPTSAMYYNDQPPDMIFYQGLALQELGRSEQARHIYDTLVQYGRAHLDDDVSIDYFAVSLPDFLVFEDDLKKRNKIHCYYMMALGHLGLNDLALSQQAFEQVLSLAPHHQGALIHQRRAAKFAQANGHSHDGSAMVVNATRSA
jgi:tetratricopeptide (TPR) repeat protein